MIAASYDPLFDDWLARWLADPLVEWSQVWTLVAARAKSLAEDSPECAAMVKARLLRTHGPNGLKFRSLYQSDESADTSAAEVEMRRRIERGIALGSRWIDAGGSLSRAEFDWQMSWNAVVLGDAFAVRVWQDVDRVPTSTRWRIVHPARVCPPKGKTNDPAYAGGIEVDGNGRPVALWVDNAKTTAAGILLPAKPERIPWIADDGTPNVVHKVGIRIPGSRRGLSEFAPIVMQARMLQGVSIAYVATKRVQASHPMLLHVGDVEKARQMYRGTRIENLLLAKDHQVEFPAWKFEGADYREFIDVTIRSLCAAWQIPWELVMGDHSAKSGASGRSLWQQHYQMAEREQAEHVNAVQRPVDESILREINARNDLGLGDDWTANMAGVYQGPPRVMPDPQKEIQWAEGMRALGVSRSTILNRFGEDFRDEIMQDRQDRELEEAQNPKPKDQPPPVVAPTAEPDNEAEDAEDSNGAETIDPEAFAALRGVRAGADMSQRDIMAVISAVRASQPPVQVINRMEVDAASAAILGEAMGKAMPPAAAPIVNLPATQVHVAPAPVTVQAASAPHVTVKAADPSPVVVNVSPTPVTIENNVEVPQRTIIAEDIGNGRVKMTPQGA